MPVLFHLADDPIGVGKEFVEAFGEFVEDLKELGVLDVLKLVIPNTIEVVERWRDTGPVPFERCELIGKAVFEIILFVLGFLATAGAAAVLLAVLKGSKALKKLRRFLLILKNSKLAAKLEKYFPGFSNRLDDGIDVVWSAEQKARAAEKAAAAAAAAPKGTDLVDDLVSTERRKHILDGDATGGGHRFGTGNPGKTEFPKSWSDERILHEISDIATDPNATAVQLTGPGTGTVLKVKDMPFNVTTKAGKPVRYKITGQRGGVDVEVIFEPGGEGVVSGFPGWPNSSSHVKKNP